MDINSLLEDVQVHSPGQWENEEGPKDWYAVSDEAHGGIFAYFNNESLALAFRLMYINMILNGAAVAKEGK